MTKKVLLVDDEVALLHSLTAFLEISGYDVMAATNAENALKIMQHDTPDIIVSDLRLPDMGGIELFEIVRQEPAWHAIPFVLVTGAAERDVFDVGQNPGIRWTLTKPFDLGDLLAILGTNHDGWSR